MKTRLGLLGFEPAIYGALFALLSGEPDFELVSEVWEDADVLVVGPSHPDDISTLKERCPEAVLLVQEPWNHRQAQTREDERVQYFQGFHGFKGLMEQLRQFLA